MGRRLGWEGGAGSPSEAAPWSRRALAGRRPPLWEPGGRLCASCLGTGTHVLRGEPFGRNLKGSLAVQRWSSSGACSRVEGGKTPPLIPGLSSSALLG